MPADGPAAQPSRRRRAARPTSASAASPPPPVPVVPHPPPQPEASTGGVVFARRCRRCHHRAVGAVGAVGTIRGVPSVPSAVPSVPSPVPSVPSVPSEPSEPSGRRGPADEIGVEGQHHGSGVELRPVVLRPGEDHLVASAGQPGPLRAIVIAVRGIWTDCRWLRSRSKTCTHRSPVSSRTGRGARQVRHEEVVADHKAALGPAGGVGRGDHGVDGDAVVAGFHPGRVELEEQREVVRSGAHLPEIKRSS